jgi:hypothetical protein
MGMRSPHEATAEVSRPKIKPALAAGARTRNVVDEDSLSAKIFDI